MAKYESYAVGDHEFDFVSFPLITHRHAFTYADLPLTIPVESNKIILGAGLEIDTAFAGGTPFLALGDGTTTTFYLTTTAAGAGNLGFKHSLGNGTGAVTGVAPDRVVVTGSTQLTAGVGAVYVFEFDLGTNWRTTGQW